MRRGESSLCGALMTHKLPHKVPHKTDIGFWNRYPTAEGCMKMHANARIFGASYN